MKPWLLIAGLACSALHASSQSPSYSFRNININEGLSQSSVVDIAIDNWGFLWLATQVGLNRYDGNEFLVLQKNFDDVTNPTDSRLGKVVAGINNKLWLITSGGKLEMLDIVNHKATPYDGISPALLGSVSCVYQDEEGPLWIGTRENGLFVHRLPGIQRKQYTTNTKDAISLPGNTVQYIFADSKKNHWILTDNGAIILNFVTPAVPDMVTASNGSSGLSCSAMDEDANNTLWLGTYGKGLYYRKAGSDRFISFRGFSSNESLPANLVIETIKADNDGKIWVGTYGNGLYIIDEGRSVVEHITANKKNPFSLSYDDVLCIRQDTRGGIWIGTDGGGISYYDKRLNNFLTLSKVNVPESAPIEQVRSITSDKDGGIWIGTSNSGLTYTNLNGDTIVINLPHVHQPNTNSPERIVALLTDGDGDIWVGTQGNGLIILDHKTKKIKRWFYPGASIESRIPDYSVWCMLPENPTQAWIGTRDNGLCLVDKTNGLIKHFNPTLLDSENSLKASNIRALARIDPNTICVGFESAGYQFLNTISGKTFRGPLAALEKTGSDAISPKCMLYREPWLWVGTLGKGLLALNTKNGKLETITEEKGLPNNTVYGILPDENGFFWMSTNKGICRFATPTDPANANRTQFTYFTAQDGLQSNEFNTGAYYRSPDGTMFFGGIKGLSLFHPERLVINNEAAKVVITRATVNNEPYATDTTIPYKKILTLPYEQNSVSFNFTALDFVAPAGISYYYQLMNYDKDWIDAGNRKYAAYTNLPAGNYIFRVKAAQGPSVEDAPVATMNIVIHPPFWQTWWFIFGCAFIVMGILYAFYRYRINQLLKVQHIRNRIASDLHDDIGSSLTNISILSELSKKNIQQESNAEPFLNRIAEEVQHASQDLDDIVWSINTNEDSLEQIVTRMRRYAAEIFDAAGIHYALDFDEQFAHRKLNMEQRRDFFLLFKEAVNNIYKHAHATSVHIRVWIASNKLHMKVEDNGKGFDTTALTHRNGIRNFHLRAERWKGSTQIESSNGNGTSIHIQFPVL